MVSKFRFLEFWLLSSRVSLYYSSLPRTVWVLKRTMTFSLFTTLFFVNLVRLRSIDCIFFTLAFYSLLISFNSFSPFLRFLNNLYLLLVFQCWDNVLVILEKCSFNSFSFLYHSIIPIVFNIYFWSFAMVSRFNLNSCKF